MSATLTHSNMFSGKCILCRQQNFEVSSFTRLLLIVLLFQYFALAHHQCRWNYNDQDDVRNVDNKMDEYDIPNDVMWLDIEHTDSKKYVLNVTVV